MNSQFKSIFSRKSILNMIKREKRNEKRKRNRRKKHFKLSPFSRTSSNQLTFYRLLADKANESQIIKCFSLERNNRF